MAGRRRRRKPDREEITDTARWAGAFGYDARMNDAPYRAAPEELRVIEEGLTGGAIPEAEVPTWYFGAFTLAGRKPRSMTVVRMVRYAVGKPHLPAFGNRVEFYYYSIRVGAAARGTARNSRFCYLPLRLRALRAA